jgi:hypothetical protein
MAMVWCRSADEREYTEARIASEAWFQYGHNVFACEPARRPFPGITLELRWRHPPADFFEPGTLFTVSDRLKAVLEGAGARAEFLPVRVTRRGKEVAGRSFYFCNVLDLVDCFDLDRGEYTFETKPGFTDVVRQVRRLVIDEQKAAGHDLFRIARGGECIVCTSDRVAAAITDAKLTGVRMVRPEDWKFGAVV